MGNEQSLAVVDHELEQKCINTIRMLAVEAVQKANSGHPGMPMGMASVAHVLWSRQLKHAPQRPDWNDRDRVVLSGGHGSMLLYAMLHLTGYDISIEDIKQFRQWGSKTPGHPEYAHTPGVETTTGPLGQGFANAVGMAMVEARLATRYNRSGFPIVDHYTYVMVGDGDLMEGVSHEAASLAGHWQLGKLICLYDDNQISIEGSTELAFTENTEKRFMAYGWQVLKVTDGNDTQAIDAAITKAKQTANAPTLIMVRTKIGYGSPNKQGKAAAHGEPLGMQEIELTKEHLNWTEPAFAVPQAVYDYYRQAVEKGKKMLYAWQKQQEAYVQAWPELGHEWLRVKQTQLPKTWNAELPTYSAEDQAVATRNASGIALNALALKIPNLLGGSADLAPSNKTEIKGEPDYTAANRWHGRNIRFGVREHAMAAIMNGMTLHGGVVVYGGTFLVFSDYMRPAMRLAALMGLKVIYVLTHDSIGLGEDGPTHQPIEHLMSLRAIPKLTVIRPADANETVQAWAWALKEATGPVVLALTRQNLPIIKRTAAEITACVRYGASVVYNEKNDQPEAIIIATGSEVEIAIKAAQKLAEQSIDVRVVSMTSMEIFAQQTSERQQQILPKNVDCIVSIEAGITSGWERFTRDHQACIGIDHFGASAPYQVLYEKFGLTAEKVVAKVRERLARA